nr:MAG TPA: hypothetical protein [Caudoviricetes sp.]
MTTTINPTLDTVQAAIATAIEAQPWYRRFANTVNASLGGVAGALATLAAAYAATGRADSTAVLVGAAAAIAAGIAARLTKNGVTPSTGETITTAVAAQTTPVDVTVAVRDAVRAELDARDTAPGGEHAE